MYGLIDGISSYSRVENTAQSATTIKNPSHTPTLNGNDFLNPYFAAFDMDIMLFGPGVIAVNTT